MNKPGIRQAILMRSVHRLLRAEERVHAVVFMWNRHRLFFPYVIASAFALYAVAFLSGIESTGDRLVIAGAGAGVAAMAATNYFVLADTGDELVLCRSSRMRQHAKSLIARLGPNPGIDMTGSTVVTSDWRVDGTIYTLTKRWEATMRDFSIRS